MLFIKERDTEGVLIYDLGNKQWNIPTLRTLLEEILPQKTKCVDVEVRHHFTTIGERVMLLNGCEMTREKEDEKLILLAIEDITERKNQQLIENKIQEIQQEHSIVLEEKVRQRTFELSEANYQLLHKNEELVKMNKDLESFTYISSHDLQEPLRKIQTYSAIAHFQRVQNAAKRMQTLIEDLLAYAQTSPIERKFEHADLNKIVKEVTDELVENIQGKSAVIEVGKLCHAYVNPSQFYQVMHNLINNALKFSIPGVLPHITIKSRIAAGIDFEKEQPDLLAGTLSAEQDYCCLTVSDNGIGFDMRYKDKIFEVFKRLNGNDKYAGTGIGLAIVKKIVEHHNGIITTSGELNKGATFNIYIPAVK